VPAALATEKCVSTEAYAVSSRRSASGSVAARSAMRSAVRLAIEPPLTRRPAASSAKPTSAPSHRTATRSTCVAAGAERHAVTFWSAAEASRSAATPTGDGGDCT
jgi:hypothetical protein